jgi:cysteine desulfurase
MNFQRQVYLDANSTTKIHNEALEAMLPFLTNEYGNSASLHSKGRAANAALEYARTAIGDTLGTEGVDIVFTSGGTESDNLAIQGVCSKNREKGAHIIASSIEHKAVLMACKFVESQGFDITYLPVGRDGMVDPIGLKKSIQDNTILVSIMYANNEVGTMQPIKEIAEIIRHANAIRLSSGKNKKPEAANRIYFHTDAIQVFGKIPIDVEALGVDLMSISSHKIYGPKGIGALYIRKSTPIYPCMHGGHQERDMRAGTVNVAGAVGFAKAADIAQSNFKSQENLRGLRDKLHNGLSEKIPGIKLNGHPEKRLPNTLNLSFEGIDSTLLIASLDLKGIFVSAGSACLAASNEKSHVLKAMSVEDDRIKSSVRFSLAVDTTDEDISYCLEEIPYIVSRIRNAHNA